MDKKTLLSTKQIVMDDAQKISRRITSTPNLTGENLKCVHCTLGIDTKPMGCPTSRVDTVQKGDKHCDTIVSHEYITFGVFCCYNCAAAFAADKTHDPLFSKSQKLLATMYAHENKICGPVSIVPSPSPLLMSCYGGVLSEEQYKTQIGKIRYNFNGTTTMFPLTSLYTKVESH